MALKNFELTWVVYDDSDPYGFCLALFTLTPMYVMHNSHRMQSYPFSS